MATSGLWNITALIPLGFALGIGTVIFHVIARYPSVIQSGMPVRKCISGEKSDIVLSNHNYGRRQIKAKWNNEEFGYFNTITKIAKAILCSLFMFWL